MYLSQLALYAYRNYQELQLALEPGLFVFSGDNAQGKTNLLEAICMLATANSFHAGSDREVVSWAAPEQVARISGTVRRKEDTLQLEINLYDPQPLGQPAAVPLPANTPRKRFKVNGVNKRAVDAIGQMRAVLFAPDDLHLVDGSPDERRRFLDRALCQVYPRYCQALVKYRKIVTQRAALLKRIRDGQEDPRMLEYPDEQLISCATYIIFERRRMIQALNEQVLGFQEAISGGKESLQLLYQPSFQVQPEWNPVEITEHFTRQLHTLRKREIAQGVCLLGPHRDDLLFQVNDVNVLTYGSRGQQRTAALSTKLAELQYMRSLTGEEPLLLLDDVFSELDQHRRAYLLSQVINHQQVFLTTTDLHGFPSAILAQAHLYKVVQGTVNDLDPAEALSGI